MSTSKETDRPQVEKEPAAAHPANSESLECTGKLNVFTPREEAVLKRIRELQLELRRVKQEIREREEAGTGSAKDLAQARERLQRLKQQRTELEREREAAAAERMRLLGHD